MRLSKYFIPTIKENPSEAHIISHTLMLRSGMIRQSSAGIYVWLPTGLIVMNKIANIVREEQNRAGAIEILMPTIQPAELWQKSGRYDAYGKEMLRITDRSNREMLYGPTNEEMITDLFKNTVKSYKQLPLNLYHIQWKFRDEVRPRFGIMRGREFLMKDNYSFDLDFEGAKESYNKMYVAYLRTFARLGLTAIPVRADAGAIGGDLSHEFQILAETGESTLYYDKDIENFDLADLKGDIDDATVAKLRSYYAMEEEKHDADNCSVAPENLKRAKGIEVGHIFYFGKKYSESMGAKITGPDGNEVDVEMGSYGIGVSRLVGALIEANHDENGIVWPEEVAPYKVGIINLRFKDENCSAACDSLYSKLLDHGVEVLYDDRDAGAGTKFADMDLIGLPWQIIIGPKGLDKGAYELKNRRTGERTEHSVKEILEKLG
ncbi:MAG: proline--tRNA ligase [Emcibacteraceae bacterium]|jgi:prolyl-tRNA synthetase|nr:proline--tRNA ligase [Kordiimonadaceae bacterium]MBT6467068.1 proline--tRNA ligase [Kordiimonadaceae bacterium]MBT7544775.1 proline--tRNA ligase [Kordiimonadaceae bacterium]|tara:strand:- start:23170 stop:24471 length:1302 start_codon:yes stop_codon:yes gene_type:complete